MTARLFSLILLFALPVIGFSQTPPQIIRPVAPPDPQQVQAEQRLRQLIQSREELTKEIERLEKLTGTYQQVMVSVQVCELSLSKARDVKLPQIFDFEAMHNHGFRGILSSHVFDPLKPAVAAPPGDQGHEAVVTQVIDDGETLESLIAELKNAGALKVLAVPTLVTVSGRPASLHIGGEFPIRVANKKGDSVVEFKAYGIQLTVNPLVLGQNKIRLDVRPTVSEIDNKRSVEVDGTKVPGLRVAGVSTRVEMESGQTFVIAGMVQHRAVATAKPNETGETKEETEAVELIVTFRPQIVSPL